MTGFIIMDGFVFELDSDGSETGRVWNCMSVNFTPTPTPTM
jgi:hypothetical protein